MKTFVLALSLLVLQQQSNTAAVQGRVIRAGTSEPLGGSRILLTKVGGRLADSIVATSDALGHFSIANIPPGTYRVFADRDDYVRAEYGQRGLSRPGSPITLAVGQHVDNMDLALIPTGAITGRITNQAGVPVPKVYVRSFKAAYAQGERTMTLVQETQSNDLGEYRLFGLTPGIYFVSAAPYTAPQIRNGTYIVPTPPSLDSFGEGQGMSSLTGLLSSGARIHPLALTGDSYAQVYYPGTLDAQGAKPIDLSPGATVPGVDLHTMLAPRVTGFRVSGQFVAGATGQNASAVRWILGSPGLGLPIREGNSPAGAFEIADVPPGRYVITGVVGGSGSLEVSLTGSSTIEVSAGNLDSIRIPITAPINLSGRATGWTPELSAAAITVRPRSGGPPIRPDGTFSIPNVRVGDDYALTLTGAPSNYYIASAKIGDLDVTENLHLGTAPTQPLLIVLSSNAGIMEGTVLDGSRRPAAGAVIVLVPELSLRKQFDLYRVAASDTAGRFHIQGIVPGNYKVFAWEDIEENAWQDPEVIRIYEGQGKPVRINDASHEILELSLR